MGAAAHRPGARSRDAARLLVKLGATEAVARAAVDNPAAADAPAKERARVSPASRAPTLEVDDGLDRAWRRVGIALDRSGFTVEDRDRAAGLYFVRYVDPKTAGQDATPGFFAKLFGASTDTSAAAVKYQVALKSDGTKTIVSVLNAQGAPDAGENSTAHRQRAGRRTEIDTGRPAQRKSRPRAAFSCPARGAISS